MKHILCTLLVCVFALTASAQKEQDFASRYMNLYGDSAGVQCITVSPLMMQQLMKSSMVGENKDLKEVLSYIKSIQMLTGPSGANARSLYERAISLLKHNPDRYKVYAETPEQKCFLRRRGETIVELVLLLDSDKHFSLLNLTGEMNEKFLKQIKQSTI